MGDVPSHLEALDQEMIQWCQGTRHGLSVLTLWSSLREDIFHVTDPANTRTERRDDGRGKFSESWHERRRLG